MQAEVVKRAPLPKGVISISPRPVQVDPLVRHPPFALGLRRPAGGSSSVVASRRWCSTGALEQTLAMWHLVLTWIGVLD